MLLFLKTLAPALMALGSIILAIRVKQILDALVRAVAAAEASRLQLVNHLVNQAPLELASEAGPHVRECQRIHVGLLVVGFLLIAAGALISGLNVYMAGL
jgi:hypothetical protein